jgi:hypothetical protein
MYKEERLPSTTEERRQQSLDQTEIFRRVPVPGGVAISVSETSVADWRYFTESMGTYNLDLGRGADPYETLS